MLTPFLGETARKIRTQLGISTEAKLEDAKEWGVLEPGTKVEKGEIIFPRLDVKKEAELMVERNQELIEKRNFKVEKEDKELITIDDFTKLDLRVGEILEVKEHPNADRLLVLTVKVGDNEKTLVSGLKGHYKLNELEGKKVIVVDNLAPHNFRGIESNGMILAGEDDGKLSVLTLDKDLPSGVKIS